MKCTGTFGLRGLILACIAVGCGGSGGGQAGDASADTSQEDASLQDASPLDAQAADAAQVDASEAECVGDGNCSGATPVCVLGECVACREDSHCGGETPACNNPSLSAFSMRAAPYTCVGCLEDDDCGGETPVCYGPGSGEDGKDEGAPSVLTCVGCRASGDCTDPRSPECNADTRSCECSASGQCTLAEAARCEVQTGSEPRMCVGCLEDADCGSVAGRPVCLDGGVCVECSTDADCPRDAGGTFVCNPDTYVCTDVESGGTELCQPCEFDTECVNGGLCTEMPFGSVNPVTVGPFCLPRANESGLCPNTSPPYRTSLNVGGEMLCSINHFLTTCEAVTAGGPSCTVDDDCPIGGVCIGATTNSNGLCSYRCDKPEDCASSESCQTDPSDSNRTVCF